MPLVSCIAPYCLRLTRSHSATPTSATIIKAVVIVIAVCSTLGALVYIHHLRDSVKKAVIYKRRKTRYVTPASPSNSHFMT